MSRMIRRIFHDQRGQSSVEFALVVPLLMLIVVVIVEFGRLWMTVNVLTSAAREGVRVAAISAPDYSRVHAAAMNVLSASQVNGATISVSGPTSAGDVRVTVRATYAPITGNIIPRLAALQLVRSSTMHWEH